MNEFDFEAIRQIAETVDPNEVAQSEDYFDEFVIPPGSRYVSHQRVIARNEDGNPDIRRKDDGSVTVVLELTGGIQAETGEIFANGAYPLKGYVSSKKYSVEGRPGQTSGLAQYLKAFGFEVGGRTTADLLALLPETLDLPIGVDIGWTDRSVRLEDGTWKNSNLKTRDFNVGSKQEPMYKPVVVKDGQTFKAKATVNGWRKLKTQ